MISRSLFFTTALMLASSAYAANSQIKADDKAIDSACASDAQTASCGDKVAGHGLVDCLHAYRKATPGFKYSPDCKAALKQRHLDKQAAKAASGQPVASAPAAAPAPAPAVPAGNAR